LFTSFVAVALRPGLLVHIAHIAHIAHIVRFFFVQPPYVSVPAHLVLAVVWVTVSASVTFYMSEYGLLT
jgi:hypothetical protein